MAGGRPSSFSEKTARVICERMSLGESLREICREDDMPSKTTVMRWLFSNNEFRDQYAKAREAQTEHWAEEIVEIADDGTNDWMLRRNKDGSESDVETVNSEHINRSRLRVDTRKWLMARMAPKKYGDRVMTELTGKDGGPIETRELSTEQRARALAAFVARTKTDK